MYDNKDIIIIVRDKADLWGPYIVYKETKFERTPYTCSSSMQTNDLWGPRIVSK